MMIKVRTIFFLFRAQIMKSQEKLSVLSFNIAFFWESHCFSYKMFIFIVADFTFLNNIGMIYFSVCVWCIPISLLYRSYVEKVEAIKTTFIKRKSPWNLED